MMLSDQPSYPDIEADDDMVCPNCQNPFWAMNVYEMETDYDGDEFGVYRSDYVTKWQCDNCDHIFLEDEALSLRGVVEDEETSDKQRAYFKVRLDQLKELGRLP